MSTWLPQQLQERGWSMRELARRIDKSHTSIAKIANGNMQPSPEMCQLIAMELDADPVIVFRKAGLLPPEPQMDEDLREAMHLLRQLSPGQRDLILEQLRASARFARAGRRMENEA